MDNITAIIKLAETLNCHIKLNEPMRNHTTFKIGGNAQVFLNIDNINQLKAVISECQKLNVPYLVLGKGSNLLINDNGIEGVVINLDGDFKNIDVLDDHTLYCGSGVSLAKLCSKALSCNLSGLEFAWGIPGSVGGAAYMNAGAYGGEMKDVVMSVTHLTKDGKVETFKADMLNFGYRHSIYKENGFFILGITVQLKLDDPKLIRERMDDYMGRRKDKQPLEYPSAGSVFKRPEGAFAGALIEQCNLKGASVGDAQVSEKHAGFIINKGNATCNDVLTLIKNVQKKVKDETGYDLEQELILL